MKRKSTAIEENLKKEGMKTNVIKTHRALVDYALLCRESPKRILVLKKKEQKHRKGYKKKPVKRGEFDDWEAEQVWVKP